MHRIFLSGEGSGLWLSYAILKRTTFCIQPSASSIFSSYTWSLISETFQIFDRDRDSRCQFLTLTQEVAEARERCHIPLILRLITCVKRSSESIWRGFHHLKNGFKGSWDVANAWTVFRFVNDGSFYSALRSSNTFLSIDSMMDFWSRDVSSSIPKVYQNKSSESLRTIFSI